MDCISDTTKLRAHYGAVNPLAERKVLSRLDNHAVHFIALSPFLVMATADAAGGVDASPRGDAPGFVRVLDETRLFLPDRPGNNRLDSYRNLLEHPGMGLIFFVPGIEETLRVNGDATVVTDPELLESSTVGGRIPKAGLLVAVREVFFHCAKALKRSRLWDAAAQVPPGTFPSLGRIIAGQTGMCSVEEAERRTEEGYRSRLY